MILYFVHSVSVKNRLMACVPTIAKLKADNAIEENLNDQLINNKGKEMMMTFIHSSANIRFVA